MANQAIRFPIRVKVLIALFICVIVPIILIGAMTFYKVNSSLMIIDQDNAMRTAISLQSTIQKQSENLLQQDIAFAKWTAFNQALAQHDLAWIKTNVDVATSVYNDLNFLAVYDRHFRLVSQIGNLPDFKSKFLNTAIQRKQQQQHQGYFSGLFETQKGLILLAVAKVTNLNSYGASPGQSYGTLVVGQAVTKSVVNSWKSIYDAEIALLPHHGPFVTTTAALTRHTSMMMLPTAMTKQLNEFSIVKIHGILMDAESVPLYDLLKHVIGVETIAMIPAASVAVISSFVLYSLVVIAVLFVMLIVFYVYLGRVIIAPVKHLAFALQDVANGILAFEANARYRKYRDEIGLLAWSYEMMRKNVSHTLEVLNQNVTAATTTIEHQSTHDSLTGLSNRDAFMERVSRWMLSQENPSSLLALMLVGLDRFKFVNETYGHRYGDELIIKVASRLATIVGDVMLCRHGADEFLIALPDASVKDVRELAEEIVRWLRNPFAIFDSQITISTSLGITMYPTDGTTIDQLFKNANVALVFAKAQGGNRYCFHTKELDEASRRYARLEASIPMALSRRELQLYYQPKASLATRTIAGAEALLRWQLGAEWISPVEFIPIAEKSGYILEWTDWILEEVCQRMKAWQEAGYAPMQIAVNLSAKHFEQGGRLIQSVESALRKNHLEARYLELEITESMLVHNIESTISTLRSLKALGVTIAIDDFGTGYSSLAYLNRFPIDSLKIDKSFLPDFSKRQGDTTITDAVIALGHSLRLKVVAEGVETKEQLDFLQAQGCDEIQGYYLSKPIPEKEFENLIQSYSHSKQLWI